MPNHDGPAPFLPAPAHLVTSAGEPCDAADGAYAASWISGVSADVRQHADVLISFNDYCVQSGGATAEGFGLAEYDPATNALTGSVTVFRAAIGEPLAHPQVLGSPLFSGRYLYLFGSYCAKTYDATCIASTGNAVYLARVPANPAAWARASRYRWYAGPTRWKAAPAAAVSVISGARPAAVTVNDFAAVGHGLVLIEQISIVGAVTIYQASRPTGTWTEKASDKVPCAIEGDSFCRAIIGHPELSTRKELLVSYFDPAATPQYDPSAGAEGHVMIAAFRW
jgi:hypothetical protein